MGAAYTLAENDQDDAVFRKGENSQYSNSQRRPQTAIYKRLKGERQRNSREVVKAESSGKKVEMQKVLVHFDRQSFCGRHASGLDWIQESSCDNEER